MFDKIRIDIDQNNRLFIEKPDSQPVLKLSAYNRSIVHVQCAAAGEKYFSLQFVLFDSWEKH